MATQVNSDNQPSVLNVVLDYVRNPNGIQNMVIQPALKSIKWAEVGGLGIANSLRGPKRLLARSSHLLFWLDYPATVRNFWKSIVEFKESVVSGDLWDIGNKTTKVYINTFFTIGMVADTIEILGEENILNLSAAHIVILEVLGFLGSIALLLHAMYGIQKQIQALMKSEVGTPEFNLALMKLAGRVLLAAGAIFSMVAFFHAQVIATGVVLTFASGLLLLTLASHFYEQLYVVKREKSVAQ